LGIGLGLRRWALFSSFDSPSACIKHISVSSQYSISITIGEALRLVVHTSPILSVPLCSANTIGPANRYPLIGEAQRIKKNPRKLLIGATNSPRFAYWRGEGAPLRL
jgi:hypothetical protein